MQHKRTFLGLLGLAANSEFNYPNYFSIGPDRRPQAEAKLLQGLLRGRDGADPEADRPWRLSAPMRSFPRNALEGAQELAKEAGLKIVYDRTYPPTTSDYTPIVRGIQATNPDLVFVASYPPDTVGMIRAASEVGLKAKLFGGGMVGLQATAIKTQLGPLLNGIVDYDFWLPVGAYATPEALEFLKRYQAKSAAAGVDLLGFYLPPFAYADMQVLQAAVEGIRQPGSAEAGGLPALPHFPHGRRRHHLRPERRMDRGAGAGGAVPEREGQRCGAVQGPEGRGRAVSAVAEERQT